ncbi:MAG: invasion associated locus B family protein [Pseudomonadota bacterium]
MKHVWTGTVLMALASAAAPAAAQEAVNRVAVNNDWSVLVADAGGRECFIASAPTNSTATRGGQTVTVRRSEIRMMVSFRPGAGVSNEVSFTGGYPFRENSRVTLQIGNRSWDMFTEGEWAWPASPSEDGQIVAAMRAGATARVTGVSSRGTQTVDTISLRGFTASINDAQGRCQ